MINQTLLTKNGAQLHYLLLLIGALSFTPTMSYNYASAQSQYLFQIQAIDAFPDSVFPRQLRTIFQDRIKARFDCVSVDLNRDGLDEKIATNKSFKGGGVYPWLIFDAQMDYLIADFDATTIYVLDDRLNDYYILECFSEQTQDLATVTRYAFDGTRYEKTESVELHGEQINRFLSQHKDIPHPDELRPDK